jgi:spore maturation protein CgeB
MGNGILTFTPRGAGLESLYGEDELVYFDGAGDLVEKIRYYAGHRDARTAIARKGWERNHRDYNGTAVAKFILSLTLRDEAWRSAPWAEHIYSK